MDGQRFGDILRKTRERKGLDLDSTARRLRIRPDILKAIEDNNFAAMPPRGYSRNMVNGYARFLGLNPTDVTELYIDQLADYERHVVRSYDQDDTGIDMSAAPENTRIPRRNANASSRNATSGRGNTGDFGSVSSGSARVGGRANYGRAYDYERYDKQEKVRQERTPHRERDTRSRAGSRREANREMSVPRGTDRTAPAQGRTRQARGMSAPNSNEQFAQLYTGPQRNGVQDSRIRFIIAALAILVVVIVICVFLFGNRASSSNDTIPNVPVTGVDDTQQTTVVEVAPTKFTFAYNVESGTTSWIEVYVDGKAQVAEAVEGPSTKSFDCSGTLEFICANTTGVTITQDGSPLAMTTNSNGVVDMTIKYSDVLAAWQAAHPNTATTSTSTSTSTSSTTSTSSSSSTTATTTR